MPRARAFALALACLFAVACSSSRDLAGSDSPDGGPGFQPGDGGESLDTYGAVDLEAGPPYAVLGVQPSHGPFSGGTRIEIRGRGFSSKTKVRIGAIDVPATDVVANDPYHVQVITPAGEPGSADVVLFDEPTGQKAILPSGFTYDAFHADPNNGATAGGTLVTLVGRGTNWVDGTTVTVDGKPCTEVAVIDATHLRCVTPEGLPGTKSISVTLPDKTVTTVRDAYTYADTADGYRGGLAGDKLPGELKVLALANPNGDLVPGATVVVRGADGVTQTGKTNVAGVAAFGAPPKEPLTVSITKKCLQPTTFDGVRVRSVTAYLSPVTSTACIPPDGQPPPVGGKARNAGSIVGELVWPGGVEFRRAEWKGIPGPTKPTQRMAAYVFVASRDNLQRLQLPDPMQATTPASPGTLGYQFSLITIPGNLTLYAIAGIEDRPEGGLATFDPYAYGIVRGVGVPIGGVVDRVLIPMNGTFTHVVKHTVTGVPQTPRGPDRIRSSLAIDMGDGFMLMPRAPREDLLPFTGEVSFVGVPPLSGALSTASYVSTIEAVTGGSGGVPVSAWLRFKSRTSGSAVPVGPFVPLPKVTSPAVDKPWDGRTVKLDLASGSADLIVVGVNSGDGSSSWTIVAPGDARTVTLPDFAASPELGLPGGNLVIGAIAAKLDGFSYDAVRYGQLGRAAWKAYAYDTAMGYW
ncbi:MAG: IPT/TIG domain-containing protein [Deltaproteobacteria bacterium]|nr:IPT/TIG domain-containing protein [Deltaproteobacteria bacterium]